jgi:DNA recombination protein RmuC
VELERQKMAGLELRMKDWETQKEESVKAAKAAILEAGGHMSSKLLEDHKREQEAAKKDQEARLQKANEKLLEQFGSVTQSVAVLREQTNATQNQMNTVWRALANPTGAGQLSEVGLENSLKNLGLEQGRDFIMQYSLSDKDTGGRLRPDAILFLPQDVVIVVDSKASKFLLELGEAQNEVHMAEARERLKKTMTKHLQDLCSKDYAGNIQEQFRDAGHGTKIQTLLNVMYLPSESALQHLKEADREFLTRAEKAGIILAGPASLHGLFSLAKLQIAGAKQADNYNHIITAVENLLEAAANSMSYVDNIGNHLKKAAEAFNNMAKSSNRYLLPRMKRLMDLGVKPAKNKLLPSPIMTYDLRRMDDVFTLELEALETPVAVLADEAKQ